MEAAPCLTSLRPDEMETAFQQMILPGNRFSLKGPHHAAAIE